MKIRKVVDKVHHVKLSKITALVISAAFILSVLTVFATNGVQATTIVPFGNTAVGTFQAQNDANAQSISYFKCTTTGTVTDIKAYVAGPTSGKAIAALYAISGTSPSTLLKQSNAASIGTTYSWVDFQLSTAYTVTSGTTYGLAIMGNIPLNLAEVSGTGQRAHNAVSSFTNGFANPFGSIWGTDNSGAMSIYATGTTSTSTPTTTPKPTSTSTPAPTSAPLQTSKNLDPIPSGWTTYESTHLSQFANVHLDSSVQYNGQPSLRIDPTGSSTNTYREANGIWIAIKPGQHVTFSVWIKTSASSYGDTTGQSGARIGIDFYGASRICPSESPDGSVPDDNPAGNYVHWGTSTWTQVVMSFTVASSYRVNGNGQSLTAIGIIPWMQVWSSRYGATDGGRAWFANAQLTIS